MIKGVVESFHTVCIGYKQQFKPEPLTALRPSIATPNLS